MMQFFISEAPANNSGPGLVQLQKRGAMMDTAVLYRQPVANETITGLSTAKGFAPAGINLNTVGYARVSVEGQPVRFWHNTTPTASVGHLLAVGQFEDFPCNLAAVRFIETTPSATLRVTYFSK